MRFFELSADAWRVFRARDEQQSSPRAASTPRPAGSSCTRRSICDQRSSRRARLETRQSQSKGPCIFRENHFASSPIWSRSRLGQTAKRIVAPQQMGAPLSCARGVLCSARAGARFRVREARCPDATRRSRLRSNYDPQHLAPVPASAAPQSPPTDTPVPSRGVTSAPLPDWRASMSP